MLRATKLVDLSSLVKHLDKKKGLYHYHGSLTTPPCTQVVNWIIVDDPQPISEEQVKVFKSKWEENLSFAAGEGNNREP